MGNPLRKYRMQWGGVNRNATESLRPKIPSDLGNIIEEIGSILLKYHFTIQSVFPTAKNEEFDNVALRFNYKSLQNCAPNCYYDQMIFDGFDVWGFSSPVAKAFDRV